MYNTELGGMRLSIRHIGILTSFLFILWSCNILFRSYSRLLHVVPGRSNYDSLVDASPADNKLLKIFQTAENRTSSILQLMRQNSRRSVLVTEYEGLLQMAIPSGYDQWLDYARRHGAMTSTHAYMRIYKDLEPFMSVDPSMLQSRIQELFRDEFTAIISIRNGKVLNNRENWRSTAFVSMLLPIVKYLPNMDIPVNLYDEPRIVLPYDERTKTLQAAASKKAKLKAENDLNSLTYETTRRDVTWIHKGHQSLFDLIKSSCPPDSAIHRNRTSTDEPDFLHISEIDSLCHQPHLHDIHGPLFTPSSSLISQQLVPMFSECKFGFNSDILFPAGMYYIADDQDARYATEKDSTWDKKREAIIWLGVNSGGSQQPDRVKNELRHRFVELMDPTKKLRLKMPEDITEFAQSIRNTSDVGFTSLINCDDEECAYLRQNYRSAETRPMKQYLNHKHLIDLDGQSFSGRFRPFMQSHSLTYKQTLYHEWWEDRFLPWIHYVPIKTSFIDLFPILRFFQYRPRLASSIATKGREDARRYFRKADMEVYLYRLLLEYARLLDATPQ